MTRAKDISKIVTDADLSGTLDVTGTVTAGGLTVSGTAAINNIIDMTGSTANYIKAATSGGDLRFITNESGTNKQRIIISNNGDISFYEDTGTTPKLFWDASAESLLLGNPTSWSSSHSLVVGSGGSVGGSQGALFIGKYDSSITSGNEAGRIDFGGSFDETVGASISAEADASWTHSSSHPTRLLFSTAASGSATPTERMRITSTGIDVTGTATMDGLTVTADSTVPLTVNRTGSQGDTIQIEDDGVKIGTVGVKGGSLFLADVSGTGLRFESNAIVMTDGDGDKAAASYSLGLGAYPIGSIFQGSGHGIYMNGGDSSANKLDDYEEGTFTPTFTSSIGTMTVGYNSQIGRYTKVGRIVHATIDIQASGAQSGGSGVVRVSGLPFNIASSPNLHAGAVAFSNNWVSSEAPSHIAGESSTNYVTLRRFDGNSEVNDNVSVGSIQTNSRVYFQITYET